MSEGCRHCYAEQLSASRLRLSPKYKGVAEFTGAGPRWSGTIRLHPELLTAPLKWKPRPSARNPDGSWMVFVNDMSDTFHPEVPFEFLDKLFALFALTPHVTWQVLTKRPERMAEYMDLTTENREEDIGRQALLMSNGEHDGIVELPLPNVWLGTSVEDQETADERIPHLLKCPAAVRFVSYEPALGPVDFLGLFDHWVNQPGTRTAKFPALHQYLHWIIVGGESGKNARVFDLDWARRIIKQCRDSGVPCFVKQLGRRPMVNGRVLEFYDLHAGTPAEWLPDLTDLFVRQWIK